MEFTEFEQLFSKALQKNSLPNLDTSSVKQFHDFTEYLLKVNQTTNLTAIRNIPDVIDKHLIDSLLVSEHIPEKVRVLDLGCGPGFPSIPLAIARPDLQVTALDSTAKKITFVSEAAAKIGLQNLTAITGRAEDRTLSKNLGKFDAVVSRAVARLNILSELCLPYTKIGGALLAMKGSKAEEELEEARNAIELLGGDKATLLQNPLTLLNGTDESRAIIKIKKNKPTPPAYPRAYAVIIKKPLS